MMNGLRVACGTTIEAGAEAGSWAGADTNADADSCHLPKLPICMNLLNPS